jgi:hypothetical protein
MRSTRLLCLGMITLTIAACGREVTGPEVTAPGSSSAPTPTTRAGDVFKPVATVKQVMTGITVPASNAVFAVAGEAPADDAGWQAVEASALAVAESGNLLLMRPRAPDDQQWREFALALVDVGVKAAEAARSKDAEKTGIAGDDMYSVCEQCHAKYLPKP